MICYDANNSLIVTHHDGKTVSTVRPDLPGCQRLATDTTLLRSPHLFMLGNLRLDPTSSTPPVGSLSDKLLLSYPGRQESKKHHTVLKTTQPTIECTVARCTCQWPRVHFPQSQAVHTSPNLVAITWQAVGGTPQNQH